MVVTINPSVFLLACSIQMERCLPFPLASLSLSSIRQPSCVAPPHRCTRANNISIPPICVIPSPHVLHHSDVSILCTCSANVISCTRYPTMHFNLAGHFKVHISDFLATVVHSTTGFYWKCFYCEIVDSSLNPIRMMSVQPTEPDRCPDRQRDLVGTSTRSHIHTYLYRVRYLHPLY